MSAPHAASVRLLLVILGAFGASTAAAQTAPPAPSDPAANLYAVEIRTGANWDAAKPAHEQAHFREHSANLKRLRDQGHLVLGARYSDKGLLVLRAASDQDAHAMLADDPSIRAKVFGYELHPFNVFYGGSVQPRARVQ
jgi:hypothetical protein